MHLCIKAVNTISNTEQKRWTGTGCSHVDERFYYRISFNNASCIREFHCNCSFWTGIGKQELIPLGKTILRQVSF